VKAKKKALFSIGHLRMPLQTDFPEIVKAGEKIKYERASLALATRIANGWLKSQNKFLRWICICQTQKHPRNS